MDALLTNPNKRSQHEIQEICKILSTLSYFDKINQKAPKCFQQCAQFVQFIKYDKGSIIFHIKSKPEGFYVILEGEVGVLIPKELYRSESNMNWENSDNLNDYQEEQGIAKQNLNLDFKNYHQIESELGVSALQIQEFERFIQGGKFKFRLVRKLTKGDSFGELGLLRNKPRAATVLCTKETKILLLNKEDYESIIKNYEGMKLQKNLEFMQRLFNHSKRIFSDQLLQIFLEFKKRKLIPQEILFRQNDKANQLFILKKGQIELWEDYQDITFRNDEMTSSLLINQNIKSKRFNISNVIGQITDKQPICISIINPISFIGEECILYAPSFPGRRNYNAKSIGDSTIYELNSKSLNNMLENKAIKNHLVQVIQDRSKFREERLSNLHKKSQNKIQSNLKQLKNLLSKGQDQQFSQSENQPQFIRFKQNKKRLEVDTYFNQERDNSNPLDPQKIFQTFLSSTKRISQQEKRQFHESRISNPSRPSSISEYTKLLVVPGKLYYKKTSSSLGKENKNLQKLQVLKWNEFLGVADKKQRKSQHFSSQSIKKVLYQSPKSHVQSPRQTGSQKTSQLVKFIQYQQSLVAHKKQFMFVFIKNI